MSDSTSEGSVPGVPVAVGGSATTCDGSSARLANEAAAELQRARTKHGPMRGAHEGYAVLLEEVDELWDEVKRRHHDLAAMRKEAIQIAAMALRFVADVCDSPEGRP